MDQEEEEIDTMQGVQKLTAGMKEKTAMQEKNRAEIGKSLFETEGDTRERQNKEREEEQQQREAAARRQSYEATATAGGRTSILKTKGRAGASPAKRKSLRREVQYDERGIEHKAKAADPKTRRGRQTPGQKDSQQMAGKQQYTAPGKARTRKAQMEEEEARQ